MRPRQLHAHEDPGNTLGPSMLASNPASILNQNPSLLGIPFRFRINRSCSRWDQMRYSHGLSMEAAQGVWRSAIDADAAVGGIAVRRQCAGPDASSFYLAPAGAAASGWMPVFNLGRQRPYPGRPTPPRRIAPFFSLKLSHLLQAQRSINSGVEAWAGVTGWWQRQPLRRDGDAEFHYGRGLVRGRSIDVTNGSPNGAPLEGEARKPSKS